MFLKFFLSFHNSMDGYSTGSKRLSNTATDASNFKLPEKQKTTFNGVLRLLSSTMDRHSQFLNDHSYSREILINLPDETMFQLETLYIYEYCYCTYNLVTKIIGFGNTKREAYDASCDEQPSVGKVYSGSLLSKNNNYMIRFFNESTEPEKMEFTCPDCFYEQVLNELKPYIVFEKNFLFKNCTDILEREVNFLDEFLDTYYENTTPESRVKYYGSAIKSVEFKYTFKMFMEDDPDIFQNKDFHESGFRILGALCLKIMKITDETF